MEQFDLDVFDANYSHFYRAVNPPERSDLEAGVIDGLLGLGPGERVIDLGCGEGRLSGRLAARGYDVLGVDSSELFIGLARQAHPAPSGVLRFVVADMRELPWPEPADGIVLWANTFGYFADEENLALLAALAKQLRPGGVLLIEQHHRDWILLNWQHALVTRIGADLMVDENEFDGVHGRTLNRRTYVRDGRVVGTARFFSRLLAPSEFALWLGLAGFEQVEFFAGDGGPLELTSPRLVVRARRS